MTEINLPKQALIFHRFSLQQINEAMEMDISMQGYRS